MTFDEDQCRVRAGHAAQNLAVLRHLVMNLMRTAPGKKRSMRKRRQLCAWDRSFLLSVLAGRATHAARRGSAGPRPARSRRHRSRAGRRTCDRVRWMR
jgi:hypothetical protein